jgi:hypothetical protein
LLVWERCLLSQVFVVSVFVQIDGSACWWFDSTQVNIVNPSKVSRDIIKGTLLVKNVFHLVHFVNSTCYRAEHIVRDWRVLPQGLHPALQPADEQASGLGEADDAGSQQQVPGRDHASFASRWESVILTLLVVGMRISGWFGPCDMVQIQSPPWVMITTS